MTSQSDVCSTVITSSRELALFKDPSTTYTDEFRQHCRNHYRDNIGEYLIWSHSSFNHIAKQSY